jgi:hypothetical protein
MLPAPIACCNQVVNSSSMPSGEIVASNPERPPVSRPDGRPRTPCPLGEVPLQRQRREGRRG